MYNNVDWQILLHFPAASLSLPLEFKSSSDYMDDMNQYRRATIVAGETVERLRLAGHSDEEAKRMVAAVINTEEFAVMKGRQTFDETRFIERLRQLPNRDGEHDA